MTQFEALRATDPAIYDAVQKEMQRQRQNLELVASENYMSVAVLETSGSHFNNKAVEGYPGHRYFGGCENVDTAENLARDRAKQIFGAEHANVQPHSGAQANMAVYFSIIKPGDPVMGLDLAHGGHLSHGHPLNFSGLLYKFVGYHVDRATERVDMDEVRRLALETKPKLIVAGGSAYSRIWDFQAYRSIADEVGAYLMVDMAHFAGLVAAGVHPNPVPYSDFVTSTTQKTLRGPRGGIILCRQKFAKDLDRAVFPGTQGSCHNANIAAKAVCFAEALKPEFKIYQSQVIKNAKALSGALADKGWRIVSGGTDNHLFLMDVFKGGIPGKEAEQALDRAGITVNKNGIPFDPNPPMNPSGVRIGTPSVTTRGMKESEMRQIATWIDGALKNRADEEAVAQIKMQVRALTSRFSMPE